MQVADSELQVVDEGVQLILLELARLGTLEGALQASRHPQGGLVAGQLMEAGAAGIDAVIHRAWELRVLE